MPFENDENYVNFMNSEEYDPIDLVKKHPIMIDDAVMDYESMSDEIILCAIDVHGVDSFGWDRLDAKYITPVVDRRIQKAKLVGK